MGLTDLHPLVLACLGGSQCPPVMLCCFLSTPKRNSCSFPEGAGLAHVGVTPGLWQLLEYQRSCLQDRDLCTR